MNFGDPQPPHPPTDHHHAREIVIFIYFAFAPAARRTTLLKVEICSKKLFTTTGYDHTQLIKINTIKYIGKKKKKMAAIATYLMTSVAISRF